MNISQTTNGALKEMAHQTDTVSRNIAKKKGLDEQNVNGNPQLQKACTDFEGLVLNQMLTLMRKNVPKSGLLDDSKSHDMYQSLRDQQLAAKMAESGGIGLADIMYKQLTGQIKSSTGK